MAAMTRNRFQKDRGPSQRMLRVGEQIRRTLSEVLTRGEVHDTDLNRMSITVSEVRVSPDLRIATAYVLPLGGHDRDDAITALARHRGILRHFVGQALTLKHTPDLRFMIDETFDRIEETNRLLSQDRVRRDIEARDEEE